MADYMNSHSPVSKPLLLASAISTILMSQHILAANDELMDTLNCALLQAEIQNAIGTHNSEMHCMEIDAENSVRDDKIFKLESLPPGFMGKYMTALERAKSNVKNEKALGRLTNLQQRIGQSVILRTTNMTRTQQNTLRFNQNSSYTLETPTTSSTSTDAPLTNSTDNATTAAAGEQKSVLVVRVIAPDAQTSLNMSQLSDSVFGTSGDPVNLASQFSACSYGQLNFVAAQPANSEPIIDGVIEVTIDQVISGTDNSVVRNAVTSALNSKLGYQAASRFDHVMYALPPGTNGGWIAYAYINSWLSVYNNDWASYVSAQMHELGHNLGLSHSGAGTNQYADQSGMMGFSYSQDDGPIMCFNAPKSNFLGWYDDKKSSVTAGQSQSFTLTGVAEYQNNNLFGDEKILLSIDGTQSLHLTLNVAKGINSGTREGQNRVMVVQQSGVENRSYSSSTLLAKLAEGESYSVANFGGEGVDLLINVDMVSINAGTGYDFATVSVVYGEPQLNRAPTADAIMTSGIENTPLDITLTGADPDGDPLTFTVDSAPMFGTLQGNGANLIYTPMQDFVGNDEFTYSVSDGVLNSNPATVSITIDTAETPNQPPSASFTFSPTTPMASETIIFDGSASSDAESNLTRYAWDFGDGQQTEGVSVSHIYNNGGTYQVTLTVTDAGQLTDTMSQMVTVLTDPNSPPATPTALLGEKTKIGRNFAVRLSWNDNADDETKFEIERATQIGRGKSQSVGPWIKITDVDADTTTFTDMPERGRYRYRIRAVNDNGASDYSNESEWINL